MNPLQPLGIAIVALTLSGCTTPRVAVSTPNSVLVMGVSQWDAPKAMKLAEAECVKHGRHAVPMPDDTPDYQKTYECKN